MCIRASAAIVWILLAQCLVLPRVCAQPVESPDPLEGTKYVLTEYSDSDCTVMKENSQTQSWLNVQGADKCYQVTNGYLCTRTGSCYIDLSCNYTSSGILVTKVEEDCSTKIHGHNLDFDYWVEARNLFQGKCQKEGGRYLKFDKPLSTSGWPNCSSFGNPEPGAAGGPKTYDASYIMQFYEDTECRSAINVSEIGDITRYEFKLFRGKQYCYDIIDASPLGEGARKVDRDIRSAEFLCGARDGGNGLLIRQYDETRCAGRVVGTASWLEVFTPLNYQGLDSLLRGNGCQRFGSKRVKMDKPFVPEHMPDCSDFACKKKGCSGGTPKDPNNKIGLQFDGGIVSSGGNQEFKRSVGLASVAIRSKLSVLIFHMCIFVLGCAVVCI